MGKFNHTCCGVCLARESKVKSALSARSLAIEEPLFFLLVEEDELDADWLGTILSFSLFLIIQSVASVRLYLGVITFGMQRIRS